MQTQKESTKVDGQDLSFLSKKEQKDAYSNIAYSYTPEHRGQAAYLLVLCTKAGIRARCLYGDVKMYSASKIPQFLDLVEQSLQDKGPERSFGHYQLMHWAHGRHIFCVALQKEDTIYTHEKAFHHVVTEQYLGRIPMTSKVKIFEDSVEMRKYLLLNRRVNLC